MIDELLLNKDYYIKHISMFLRDGYGIAGNLKGEKGDFIVDGHMDIFLEYIQSLNNLCDYQINVLDIWNKDYIKDLKEMYRENGISEDTPFEPLDKIAEIVGCKRINSFEKPTSVGGTAPETIVLNNEELLELIKISIVQNNYKGTFEELESLYEEKLGYKFYATLVTEAYGSNAYKPAWVNVYIGNVKNDGTRISNNLKELYLYNDLFIRSLGIQYQVLFVDYLDDVFTLDEDQLDDESKYLG